MRTQCVFIIRNRQTNMTSQEFDNIYRKNYPVLYRLAFSMLRDDEESRDVVNEVFADLLDNANEEMITNIGGYLFRVVRNRVASIISHRSTLERFRRLYPIEISTNSGYDYDYDTKLLQVMQFLDKNLTPNAREAVRLVFERGLSYKDAAEQMGVSVGMINKHIVKSLRLLREQFSN